MVRLPREDTKSLHALEQLMIRAPDGSELPLPQAVQTDTGRAYTQINRVNGRRVLNVSGEVLPEVANADKIQAALSADFLPALAAQYPLLRQLCSSPRPTLEAVQTRQMTNYVLAGNRIASRSGVASRWRSTFAPSSAGTASIPATVACACKTRF
jgi:hypothetical protein